MFMRVCVCGICNIPASWTAWKCWVPFKLFTQYSAFIFGDADTMPPIARSRCCAQLSNLNICVVISRNLSASGKWRECGKLSSALGLIRWTSVCVHFCSSLHTSHPVFKKFPHFLDVWVSVFVCVGPMYALLYFSKLSLAWRSLFIYYYISNLFT